MAFHCSYPPTARCIPNLQRKLLVALADWCLIEYMPTKTIYINNIIPWRTYAERVAQYCKESKPWIAASFKLTTTEIFWMELKTPLQLFQVWNDMKVKRQWGSKLKHMYIFKRNEVKNCSPKDKGEARSLGDAHSNDKQYKSILIQKLSHLLVISPW